MEKLLTHKELAVMLQVKPETVRDKYAYESNFPRFIRIGDGKNAPKRWLESEVIEWIKGTAK